MIVKIDGIETKEQAAKLQDLGVDVIGISLDDMFVDHKNMNETSWDFTQVRDIDNALQFSQLAIEVPVNNLDWVRLLDDISPAYIQTSSPDQLPLEIINDLSSRGIGIIKANITTSPDDDPSWILGAALDGGLEIAFYQIDLLTDIEDSWQFLNIESPKFPNELQIADVVELGLEYPLLVSTNYDEKNVNEILKSLESSKGIFLRLNGKGNVDSYRSFDYETVLKILDSFYSAKKK